MNIKAILFDIDGVLVDSEPFIAKVSVEVFKDLGLSVDTSIYPPYLGAGDRTFIEGISDYYNYPLDFEKTKKSIYDKYEEVISQVGPIKGVTPFLDACKKAGIKMALASSAPLSKIKMNLKAIGKPDTFFDAIVSGDDIKNNKPHPDIYILAGKKVNENLENCLVIEDSTNGVLSGLRAKAKVLGITSGFEDSQLRSLGAFATLDNFEGFSNFNNIKEFNKMLDEIGKDDRISFGAIKCFVSKKYPFGEKKLLDNAIKVATEARLNSYSPYSNFKVGAAIISASTNEIYGGCNVENASYGATICAERGALMKMLASEGATGVSQIVVVTDANPPAPPCALCLQVLSEFSNKDTLVHLVDLAFAEKGEGVHQILKFEELLPHPFIFD